MIEHAHGDYVAPRLGEPSGDLVAARGRVILRRLRARRAHPLAVPVRHVEVVDRAQREGEVGAGPVGRQRHLAPKPDRAVDLQARALPQFRLVHVRPALARGADPRVAELLAAVPVVLVEALRFPLGQLLGQLLAPGGVGDRAVEGLDRGRERRVGDQRLARRPGLGGRTAPGRLHEPDRHAERAVQVASEMKRHRREGGRVRGVADPPLAGGLGLGRGGGRLRHDVKVQPQAPRGGGVCSAPRARERELHVGLPRRDPDLARPDVGEGQRVRARDLERVGPARGERGKGERPAAVCIGLRRGARGPERGGHRLAGCRLAGEAHRSPLLDDHVIADERVDLDLGAGEGGVREHGRDGGSKGVRSDGSDHGGTSREKADIVTENEVDGVANQPPGPASSSGGERR